MKKIKLFTMRRLLVSLFLIGFGIVTYICFKGNYLEYKELGEAYLETFLTKQKYQYCIMAINFVCIYLLMFFTGNKIKKGLKVFFEQEKKEFPRLPNKSIAIMFSSVESIIVSILFTPKIILWISNIGFGRSDPIFGLDISFFMFLEPLIKMSITYFIGIFVFLILYVFIYYVIVFNKYFDGIDKGTLVKSYVMKTLYRNIKLITIGISAYILICSMDVVFDNFLTTDNNIKLAGSGLVDSTIKYWGYNILAIVLLISVFGAVDSFKKENQTKVLKNLAIVPIYLILLFIVMVIFDFVFVRPNEFDKEKAYIEHNIESTKRAYGIDFNLETLDYTGTITVDEVEKNQNIINNTVIIDKQKVLDNLEETQKGTGYYIYKNAKIACYKVGDEKRIVYISPREIVSNRRTYNSKTYEYTHGYGLIFTSATDVTEDGGIKYIQNDIAGGDEKIKIKTPQIYYGLETNTTVVTNVRNQNEFDYADNETTHENNYEGNSGLSLNFIDRLILGIKEKNINLAFSGSVTSKSKVLINRNIIKRAKNALSDVIYDENPYTVVDENGDIYWVLDAYTVSRKLSIFYVYRNRV